MSANKNKCRLFEPVSLETSEIINEQIKKNLCEITIGKKSNVIGAFCKVPFPDEKNLLPVLITNDIVFDQRYRDDENELVISLFNSSKPIHLNFENRIKYVNDEYKISIIEIKEKSDGINNFFELDDAHKKSRNDTIYKQTNIYASEI